MSTTTQVILISMSSLSLLVSTTTLVVVLVGGKQIHKEVEVEKKKINRAVGTFKTALDQLEL